MFKRQTKVTPVEFQEAKTFLLKFRSRSTSTEPQFSNPTDLTDLPLNENVQAFRLWLVILVNIYLRRKKKKPQQLCRKQELWSKSPWLVLIKMKTGVTDDDWVLCVCSRSAINFSNYVHGVIWRCAGWAEKRTLREWFADRWDFSGLQYLLLNN